MLKKIDEIKKALDNNMYQCALALSLTLPDICGQIQYPQETKVGKRYIDWCNNNIDFKDTKIGFGFEENELSSNMIYALRCAFLHSGNDDILSQPASTKINITSFKMVRPNTIQGGYGWCYKQNSTESETIIDVAYLCNLICDAAKKFYDNETNKAVFDDHICMFESSDEVSE